MSFNTSLANQERIPQQALSRDSGSTVSGRVLLVSVLLLILAVALASWLPGYGTGASAGEGVPAVDSAAGIEAEIPSQLKAAEGASVKNHFPNPESWYRDTSPYAGQPLAISSGGGGMNTPK
jgi:hypothetical protein